MTTITALPSAPNRSTDAPATYVTKADAMMAALPTFVTETNTVAGEVNTNATTATTQATNAATSASNAAASAATALNAPGTSATSTTSVAVGTGSKSFTIQTGKSFVAGQFVIAARTSAVSNYMIGQITSYDSGTGALVINAIKIGGSGTYTDWSVSLQSNPELSITFLDKGNSGTSTQTINYQSGNHQKITATGNFTVAFSNFPASGTLGVVLLEAANFGAYTVTWPTINWVKPDGTTTTSVSTWLASILDRSALQSSGTDWFKFWTRDGGTTVYGGFSS